MNEILIGIVSIVAVLGMLNLAVAVLAYILAKDQQHNQQEIINLLILTKPQNVSFEDIQRVRMPVPDAVPGQVKVHIPDSLRMNMEEE